MGILDRIFRRKKEEPIEELPPLPPVPEISEPATVENMKTKVDLILSQVDSLRMRYEAMNERIVQIEKMVKELYDMAKSG